jgi:hypothetical protein
MSFCQMLTVLGVFKARGTALFNELVQRPASIAGGGISSALPLKCLLNSQVYGTFGVNMLTPILACALTAFLIGPVWLVKRLQEAVLASYPPRRAPLEKVRTICCCRSVKMAEWERKMWMQQQKERQAFQPGPRFIAVLVFVLFGIYPTLVKSIFSVFRCSEPIGGKMYLEDDYSVQCWVGWHPTFAFTAAAFGFGYLFGIPLGLLLILKFNRRRLDEPRFMATFGFVYNGYHTNRGLVVAWESFVMLRKLAVTAITVSSSDPYIQIFVALLLLIISYGMQERVMPFETSTLNNIEGAGLFSLIFTQIVSILYLYIDSRAEATGNKDKQLEYIVTAVLMFANCFIASMFVLTYLYVWKNHYVSANREYRKFIEERDEPFGAVSRYRNPRRQPRDRLKVFRVKTECDVHFKPMLSSEKTGERMEEGKTVIVSRTQAEFVTVWCKRGREVAWLELSDGTGWILHSSLSTADPNVELVGHRDDDGTIEHTFLRFMAVSSKPIPIRAGTSGHPFVWPTGEFIMPDESFLVDMRFLRQSRCCCSVKEVTYLHLADRRGWIVEPTFVPDVDWISEHGFVDESVLVRLSGSEEHVGGLSTVGVSEYEALGEDVPIYAKDTWPLTAEVGTILSGVSFFVDDRSHVFTRLRFRYFELCGYGQMICCPRSIRVFRRIGRFATFVKLSDGSGYALTNRRSDDSPLVSFSSLRTDSVGRDSRSMLRWHYVLHVQTPVHRSLNAALTSVSLGESKKQSEHDDIHTSIVHYAPLPADAEVSIIARRVVKTKGALASEVTVGELERGTDGEGMGWIVLAPFANNGDVELLRVEIVKDLSRVYAVNRERDRAEKERQRMMDILRRAQWWSDSGIALGDSVAHATHGSGVVVAISPDDDGKVHVEFSGSFESYSYAEKSWNEELTHMQTGGWWTRRWDGGISIGVQVAHPTRGIGTVIAFARADGGRVEVEVDFGAGDVHRYAEHSWAKMRRVGDDTPATKRKLRQQLRHEARAARRGQTNPLVVKEKVNGEKEEAAKKTKRETRRERRAAQTNPLVVKEAAEEGENDEAALEKRKTKIKQRTKETRRERRARRK